MAFFEYDSDFSIPDAASRGWTGAFTQLTDDSGSFLYPTGGISGGAKRDLSTETPDLFGSITAEVNFMGRWDILRFDEAGVGIVDESGQNGFVFYYVPDDEINWDDGTTTLYRLADGVLTSIQTFVHTVSVTTPNTYKLAIDSALNRVRLTGPDILYDTTPIPGELYKSAIFLGSAGSKFSNVRLAGLTTTAAAIDMVASVGMIVQGYYQEGAPPNPSPDLPETLGIEMGVSSQTSSRTITVSGDIAELKVTANIDHPILGDITSESRIKLKALDVVTIGMAQNE